MKETQRCSKCILPETFPQITFNDSGFCNFCENHKPVAVAGEKNLRKILLAKKGKFYDCVVPISGGKDSAYVLYYAVKILNLNVIAVNFKSGFQSDLARKNIEIICSTLGVPLKIIKINNNDEKALLKEALFVSEIVGDFFKICGNCETNIRVAAINTAKEFEVPFILYGSSSFEKTGDQSFKGWKAFIHKIQKRNIPKLAFHMSKYCFYSIRQRKHIGVPLKYSLHPIYLVPFPKKGVQVIRFFDYIEWDSMNKVAFLRKELGWKSPENQPDRFDCLLHCFENYSWVKTSGISLDGFHHSIMIRENRLERDKAILFEAALEKKSEKECLEIINSIGLKKYKMPALLNRDSDL